MPFEPDMTKSYSVKWSDTLGQIAVDNKITVAQIMQLNPEIENPDRIQAGQEIKIPIDTKQFFASLEADIDKNFSELAIDCIVQPCPKNTDNQEKDKKKTTKHIVFPCIKDGIDDFESLAESYGFELQKLQTANIGKGAEKGRKSFEKRINPYELHNDDSVFLSSEIKPTKKPLTKAIETYPAQNKLSATPIALSSLKLADAKQDCIRMAVFISSSCLVQPK